MIDYVINSVFSSMTYILPVGSQKDCWLVDCGDVEKVIEQGWYIRGVLLTHSHSDHIYGLNRLIGDFPEAWVYTNEAGREGLMNPKWNFSKYHTEVETFMFCKPENVRVVESEGWYQLDDGFDVDVLFTPGHELSCLSYRIGNMLFTGDAYIPGVKTVVTFPRSNKQQAAESLARLQEIERLGLDIKPGHWIENNEDK